MEVKLVESNIDELKELITLAFKGDSDLLSDYHISPGTLEHCVEHTYDTIFGDHQTRHGSGMRFYVALIEPGIRIGYTVILLNDREPNMLNSFGINKDFRHKEILTEWLEKVQEITGVPYFTALHDKNTRAIEFFTKNGFISVDKPGFKLLIKCP